jgi:hypothetical protein
MKRSIQKVGSKQIIVGLADLFGNEVLSEELLELVDRTSRRQPGLTISIRAASPPGSRPKKKSSLSLNHPTLATGTATKSL